MSITVRILVCLAIVFTCVGGLVSFALWRALRQPPRYAINRFVRTYQPTEHRTIVVCAGDSLTHGQISTDYVARLRSRFKDVIFVNAGINGNLSDNLLARLDPIIRLNPTVITILIGTNDVNASLNDEHYRMYQNDQGITAFPTAERYRDNLQRIVDRIKSETSAELALLSIPPLGEDLDEEQNRKVAEHNAIIKTIAEAEGIKYLPFNEQCIEVLENHPDHVPPPRPYGISTMLRAGIQHYLFGQSWSKISQNNGMILLTDYTHLNEHGGEMVAGLIEGFLKDVLSKDV